MTENTIKTTSELLAHAYQMERDAEERYAYLADQMESHNNTELTALFRKLSWVEGQHAQHILHQMAGLDIPELRPSDAKWKTMESPEALDLGDMHYLMTPRAALLLALQAEKNAFQFFSELLADSADPDIKKLAAEFADEEREHVDLVRKELDKYPESETPPLDDMDSPVSQG